MMNAVRVHLRAKALRDHIDEIVLEILRDARDERYANGGTEQKRHASDEFTGRVILVSSRIRIDDVPENQRIKEGKDLVDRRQNEREGHQCPVFLEITVQNIHSATL